MVVLTKVRDYTLLLDLAALCEPLCVLTQGGCFLFTFERGAVLLSKSDLSRIGFSLYSVLEEGYVVEKIVDS